METDCLKNLLVIDTSTRSTVLGLKSGDDVLDRTSASARSHSRNILPAIDALLHDGGITVHDLDGIIFGQGPGSFTGLRIAVGVVQGLGYGASVPAIPVSSMACLAQSARDSEGGVGTRVLVALSARLEEIYHGTYQFDENGIAVPFGNEGVSDVSALGGLGVGDWIGLGNAWALRDKIEAATGINLRLVREHSTPAVDELLTQGLYRIGLNQMINAIDAKPVYLREEVADKPGTTGR